MRNEEIADTISKYKLENDKQYNRRQAILSLCSYNTFLQFPPRHRITFTIQDSPTKYQYRLISWASRTLLLQPRKSLRWSRQFGLQLFQLFVCNLCSESQPNYPSRSCPHCGRMSTNNTTNSFWTQMTVAADRNRWTSIISRSINWNTFLPVISNDILSTVLIWVPVCDYSKDNTSILTICWSLWLNPVHGS